jgi:hypothetical protein
MGKKSRSREKFARAEATAALGGIAPETEREGAGLEAERLVELADRALQDYDYERAHNLLKLAVLRSEGNARFVCRLASFLVDESAGFDEAIRLLTSGACTVDLPGESLLARAYLLSGRKPEALTVYHSVNESGGIADSWLREGMLLAELGRPAEAVVALSRAADSAALSAEGARARKACEEAVSEAVRPQLAVAEAHADRGEIAAALEVLEQVRNLAWLPPEYYRLKGRVDRAVAESRIVQLLDKGNAQAAAGELGAAEQTFRSALALDPACELAAQALTGVLQQAAKADIRTLVGKGNEALQGAHVEEAVQAYAAALARRNAPTLTGEHEASVVLPGVSEEGHPLASLVASFMRAIGKPPAAAQARAIESLFLAAGWLAKGDVGMADVVVRKAGGLLDQLPEGRSLAAAIGQAKTARELEQAAGWLQEGESARLEGRLKEAAEAFERAGKAGSYPRAAEAQRLAREARRELERQQREAQRARRFAELLEKSEFFALLREIRQARDAGEIAADDAAAADAEKHALDGVAMSYPLEVVTFPKEGLAVSSVYRSSKEDLAGLSPETLRVLSASPAGRELFVFSGDRLLLLDLGDLRPVLLATLPSKAGLSLRAFALLDLFPGDRNGLVVLNLEAGLLLRFAQKRNWLELENELPLGRLLQQSRTAQTRWFTLNGREEQLLVCQSAPGAASSSRLYALSLTDGKLQASADFNQALIGLRRVPGMEGTYLANRFPEPAAMKRPGYYSFVFLDSRLRVVERGHVPPDELEGAIVESTQWVRIGPLSGRRYFLFRCFDASSGQLLPRPLAFVAANPDGALAFAAADSSTLVRHAGDLDPLGEVVVREGRELLAMGSRGKAEHSIFLISAADFRVVEKVKLPEGHFLVALARGRNPGDLVAVSIDRKGGGTIVAQPVLGEAR